jgi:hypothetical protein
MNMPSITTLYDRVIHYTTCSGLYSSHQVCHITKYLEEGKNEISAQGQRDRAISSNGTTVHNASHLAARPQPVPGGRLPA